MPLDVKGHLFSRHPVETVEVLRGLDHSDDLILGEARMSYRCAWCDASRNLQIDGDTVVQPEPCPYPDGITSVITLAVPSGKLVVYDDLRDLYPLPGTQDDYASYNSTLGQHQVIEAYATQGLAYGPVSNTCPGLYRTGEGAYAFASPEYDEDKDDNILPDGWTYAAGVVTDLWAYSVADFDDFTRKGGTIDTGRWKRPEVVTVGPGTYRFTHHTGERAFDYDADGTVIYAHIEHIGA